MYKEQNPAIYTTARLSPVSLTYYELGLENELYRAELHLYSHGEVLDCACFDAYLQGVQVLKDFNINEVSGESTLPVVKKYTVNIIENFLKVQFF